MVNSICAVDECERRAHSRGWCSMHYKRWAAHGDPEFTKHRTVCCVTGCGRKHIGAGYCIMHYSRVRRYGDPDHLTRTPNVGECSYDGCSEPMRKLQWCATHYGIWRREGDVRPLRYKWSQRAETCVECGAKVGMGQHHRRYCSDACYARALRSSFARPRTVECARCGAEVDLTSVRDGRIKRVDTRLCYWCRHQKRYGMSAAELAARDGSDCAICGSPVDMSLTRRESEFCPSVDHRVPRAKGGSDDPSNLQLAHYWCNAVKSDREDFMI